jgi:hypothetical protein
MASTSSSSVGSGFSRNFGKIVAHEVECGDGDGGDGCVYFQFHWTGSTDNSDDDVWLPRGDLMASENGREAVRRYEHANGAQCAELRRDVGGGGGGGGGSSGGFSRLAGSTGRISDASSSSSDAEFNQGWQSRLQLGARVLVELSVMGHGGGGAGLPVCKPAVVVEVSPPGTEVRVEFFQDGAHMHGHAASGEGEGNGACSSSSSSLWLSKNDPSLVPYAGEAYLEE